MEVVRNLFHQVISRFGDIPWPACLPDLTISDFFLWGFLKECAYRNNPHTTEELKLLSSIKVKICCADFFVMLWIV
jgi:hypothetical protein